MTGQIRPFQGQNDICNTVKQNETPERAFLVDALPQSNFDFDYHSEQVCIPPKTSPPFMQSMEIQDPQDLDILGARTVAIPNLCTPLYTNPSELIGNGDSLNISDSYLQTCSEQLCGTNMSLHGNRWGSGLRTFSNSSLESSFPRTNSWPSAASHGDNTERLDKARRLTLPGLDLSLLACGNDKSTADQLGMVLESSTAAGFENFDAAVTAYYTAKFDEHSPLDQIQDTSRCRHLETFLSSLHESSKGWTRRSSRGYNSATLRSCEELYVNEARQACANPETQLLRRCSPSGLSLELDAPSPPVFNMRKDLLQDRAPELWSLLCEIVSTSGIAENERSFVVTLVITVLFSGIHWRQSLKQRFSM